MSNWNGRQRVGFILAALVTGCATPAPKPVKEGYNFNHVRRIAIGAFDGNGANVVSQEFVRQLLATGLTITDQPKTADATLTATIVDYKSAAKSLVYLGVATIPGQNGQSTTMTNPMTSTPTGDGMSETSNISWPKTQVVAVNAEVGVIARLIDVRTGAAVWTRSYSYEALDIQVAVRVVAESLCQQLSQTLQRKAMES